MGNTSDTAKNPLWHYSYWDFAPVPTVSVPEYQQIIEQLNQQLAQEYPEVAAQTMLLDPTLSASVQLQNFIARAEKQNGPLSKGQRAEMESQLATLLQISNAEMNQLGGPRAFTATFKLGGRDYHIIDPVQPIRRTRDEIIQTIVHELNHAVTVTSDLSSSGAVVNPARIHAEWSAVLAEYSYMLARDPSPQSEERLRMRHVNFVVAVINSNGDTKHPEPNLAANYPYAISDAAFEAMIQQTRQRVANGEQPSLRLANEVSASVLAQYEPSKETIAQDVAALTKLFTNKQAVYAQSLAAGRNKYNDYHAYLTRQPDAWAQRIAGAQDALDALIRHRYPQAVAAYEQDQTGAEPAATTAALGAQLSELNGIDLKGIKRLSGALGSRVEEVPDAAHVTPTSLAANVPAQTPSTGRA